MKQKAKNSLAHKILKAVAIGGVVVIAATNPYFGLAFMKGVRKDLERKKWWEFQKELRRLKKMKRINTEQNPDGSFTVTITQLGKDYVARYDLDSLTIDKPKEWDGLWRVCSFDIPTDKKAGRSALLSKLKELGFIMIQKSVWTHPFECREQLAVLAKAFEIKKYVYVFTASDFDGHHNRYLKTRFERQNNSTLS